MELIYLKAVWKLYELCHLSFSVSFNCFSVFHQMQLDPLNGLSHSH